MWGQDNLRQVVLSCCFSVWPKGLIRPSRGLKGLFLVGEKGKELEGALWKAFGALRHFLIGFRAREKWKNGSHQTLFDEYGGSRAS